MPDWSEFSKLGQAIVNKVRLGTAVDGPIVISVVAILVCTPAYVITKEQPLLYIIYVAIGIFGVGYLFFMISNPNKLRSEKHEQTVLRMSYGLGEQGKREIPEEKFVEMEAVTNPGLKKLDTPKERQK